jgi:hypothetical protein
VNVEVLGDAGAGGGPEVDADVESVGLDCLLQARGRGGHQAKEAVVLGGRQIGEAGDVPPRDDQQVRGRKGVTVEGDVGELVGKKSQILAERARVVLCVGAEHTARTVLRAQDVLHAPRRPHGRLHRSAST